MSLFHLPHWASTILIWSIWAVTPLSWLYTANYFNSNYFNSYSYSPLWLTLASIEVIFSIYHSIRAHQAQRQPIQSNNQHSLEFLRDTMQKIVASGLHHSELSSSPLPPDHPRAIEFRSHLTLWFRNSNWMEIKRENLREWLSWSLYGIPLHPDLDQQEPRSKLLEESLVLFENRAGIRLQPGYNPNLAKTVIRLTLDPIHFQHRPLALYLLFHLAHLATKRMLTSAGFHQTYSTHPSGYGLKYFIRKPSGWDDLPHKERTLPLIFAHGLGIGMFQYIMFLKYLAHSSWARKRPIVILIQPSISQQLFSTQHLRPPTKETLTADITHLIERHDFANTGVELVGHSMGTIVVAWIVKALANTDLIKRICLIDPVCFCLWEAHVCYNFLYSEPRTPIEQLMRYFVGTELGIGHHLGRYFNWSSNILWPAEVPGFAEADRVKVFLSEKDSILDARRVHQYLVENGMDPANAVFLAKDAAHGESIIEMGQHFHVIRRWFEA